MCRQIRCSTCQKITWAGCGEHIDAALQGVPEAELCTCPA